MLLGKKVKKYKTLFYSLMIVLGIIIIWDVINHINAHQEEKQVNSIASDNPVWADFVNTSKPTLFVLGDYFIYYEKDVWTHRSNKIRDGAINSRKDLLQMHKKFPEKAKLFTGTITGYYAPDIVRSLEGILPFFTLNKIKYHIMPARELSDDDLKSNNIVFIGPYKTLYILNGIIEKLRLKYQIYPHQIILNEDEKMDYLNIPLPDHSNYYRDYVLFAKVPGPNDNVIMIMAFFTPGSVLEKIQPMLENSGIESIREEYLEKGESFPTYFEALFESNDVKGSVTADVTHFHPIDKSDFSTTYLSQSDSTLSQ
jgi:hypothetical protein